MNVLCKRGLFHVISLTVIYIRQVGIAAAGGESTGLGGVAVRSHLDAVVVQPKDTQ